MSSAVKILPHYTYEEWRHWEGRWELIEGIPYAMSPAPVPKHQRVSANIKYELIDAIRKKGCKDCKVYDFIDLKINEDTIVQPDAVVVCDEIKKPYLDFPAAIVVEVLSPSTAMKDRSNKFYIYEAQTIPYYIIIDIDKETIEIYKLVNGKYQADMFENTYTFILEDGCSINVKLNNIWQ